MASFIKDEEVNTRAGILKLMKKRRFSLVSPTKEDEGATVQFSQDLIKSEVYVVRYERNLLVSNWLTSYIWVSVCLNE